MSEEARDTLATDLARFLTTLLGPIHIDNTGVLFEDDTDLFGLTQINVHLVEDIYNRALKILKK